MTELSEHLAIHTGEINVGILHADGRTLLIDYGVGSVEATLQAMRLQEVDRIVFTHHHRDQASGVGVRARNGARIGVPADERPWFESVEAFWNDPAHRWHLYDDHPHPLMLAESIPVHDEYEDGAVIEWGPAVITVIGTPGHTDGSISYLVEVDGRQIAFTGDLIYGPGQLWDAYSIQKGERHWSDYHGFLGAREAVIESLRRLVEIGTETFVPSHGPLIDAPDVAAGTLISRLEACYDQYVAVSALRYYDPELRERFKKRRGQMPIRECLEVPPFLRHIGTTWVLLSETREAFVMDCGSEQALAKLAALIDAGTISQITGLWVTHYHDDHVDQVPAFQERFACTTYADPSVADVIENPTAYRLPCISPSVARIDHRTSDGDTWRWNEFTMTARHFPGQTLYHGGLFVEGRGVRMLFAGDSFTPGGMDDYCAANRNLLGEGRGLDRCLDLIEEHRPTHIFNCHVDGAFDFTAEQIAQMRANLRERETAFGELFPWDHPNYGLDPHWARGYPYEQVVRAGSVARVGLAVTNHSDGPRSVTCRPILPSAWRSDVAPQSITVAPKQDGLLTFDVHVPMDADPGRAVIPFELEYAGRSLGQFREAILVVETS